PARAEAGDRRTRAPPGRGPAGPRGRRRRAPELVRARRAGGGAVSAREIRRIDVGGARLSVELAGRGPALLLLHGFTGSAETRRELADALAPSYRTTSAALLGHGRSDAPRDPSRYALECTAGDLARVLDALGESRAHVLGYSLGGRVGLGLAALRPQRVR